MPDIKLTSPTPVTLAGAAPFSDQTLRRAQAHAPALVAADGGANLLHAANARPSAIIGDLDSLDMAETWQNSDVAMFEVKEQDTTDFEKCLYSIRAPLILGIGFLGARIDHSFAALNALVRYPDQRVILFGDGDLVFGVPERIALTLEAGATVSLCPMGACRALSCSGLEWDVTGLAFAPDGKIGTSNRARGGPVELVFDGPGMLVSLPDSCLDQVVGALNIPAR